MSQDTKQTMPFQEIFGKKVQVDFNGAQNSSDAGFAILCAKQASLNEFILDLDDTDSNVC